MCVHVPVLLGLSANSPFWRAGTTGLASTRTPIFRAFPRVGIPPHYEDWEDYERRIEFMIKAGVIEDYTYLWHDVRPHPNFGTVEIRVMDSQTHIEHSLGLAALVQAMVRELAEHFEAVWRASWWTCPAPIACPPGRWRDGCLTACASTAPTWARCPSSRRSRTCWRAGTGRLARWSSTRPTTICAR
jgi:Glutamate-cysteine ligase family 2(GCS2)